MALLLVKFIVLNLFIRNSFAVAEEKPEWEMGSSSITTTTSSHYHSNISDYSYCLNLDASEWTDSEGRGCDQYTNSSTMCADFGNSSFNDQCGNTASHVCQECIQQSIQDIQILKEGTVFESKNESYYVQPRLSRYGKRIIYSLVSSNVGSSIIFRIRDDDQMVPQWKIYRRAGEKFGIDLKVSENGKRFLVMGRNETSDSHFFIRIYEENNNGHLIQMGKDFNDFPFGLPHWSRMNKDGTKFASVTRDTHVVFVRWMDSHRWEIDDYVDVSSSIKHWTLCYNYDLSRFVFRDRFDFFEFYEYNVTSKLWDTQQKYPEGRTYVRISGDGDREAVNVIDGLNVYEKSGIDSWKQVGETIPGYFNTYFEVGASGKRIEVKTWGSTRTFSLYEENAGIWTKINNVFENSFDETISHGAVHMDADGLGFVLWQTSSFKSKITYLPVWKKVCLDKPRLKCSRGSKENVSLLNCTSKCSPCAPGKFSNVTGSLSCEKCPQGSFQDKRGQTSCNVCPYGTFSNSIGATECSLCQPGSFSNLTGSLSCEQCSLGYYTNEIGSSLCKKCPMGFSTESRGSTSCSPCPPGSFSNQSGPSCTLCSPGTYQDKSKQSRCNLCEIGYYANGNGLTSCKRCPIGFSTAKEGSDFCTISKCPHPLSSSIVDGNCTRCIEGFYLNDIMVDLIDLYSDPDKYCRKCDESSMHCPEGTNIMTIQVKNDYWRGSNNTAKIYKCNYKGLCHSETRCKKGHEGALCEVCRNDESSSTKFFDKTSGKCRTCKSRLRTQILILGILALAIPISIWLLHRRLAFFLNIAATWSLRSKIKSFVGFYQIISSFRKVYGVSVNSRLVKYFAFIEYLGLDLFNIPPECIGVIQAFVLKSVWPYILCLFIFAIVAIIRFPYRNSFSVSKVLTKGDVMHIIVLVFYFALPVLSRNIFDAIRCESFQTDDSFYSANSKYLSLFKKVTCDDINSEYQHLEHLFWAFFSVFVLFPILILLSFAIRIRNERVSIQKQRPSELALECRFLWADYDENSSLALYWDLIDFFRKITLVGFVNFIDIGKGTNRMLRLSVALGISIVYLTILTFLRPYKRHDDFKLSVISAALVTLGFGLSFPLKICDAKRGNQACYDDLGFSNSYQASFALLLMALVMMIITLYSTIKQTTTTQVARLKVNNYLPNLELPPDCQYHLFISHVWKSGQDKCHAIVRRVQQYMPQLKVWLDVDNLEDVEKLEEFVAKSAVVFVFYSDGYFHSRNCRREFLFALKLQKPIIVVYDGNDRTIKEMRSKCLELCCTERLVKYHNFSPKNADEMQMKIDAFLQDQQQNSIQWLKKLEFSSESLKLIYLQMLQSLPRCNDHCYREQLQKGLKIPREVKYNYNLKSGVEIIVHNYSEHFIELVNELLALDNSKRIHITISDVKTSEINVEEGIEISDDVSYVSEREIIDVNKEELGEDDLSYSSEIFSVEFLPKERVEESVVQKLIDIEANHSPKQTSKQYNCRIMLLYLNKDTFSPRNKAAVTEAILNAKKENVPIILIHEQDVNKGAVTDFDYFFRHTPDELLDSPCEFLDSPCNLYNEIAIPLYSRVEYRQVSLHLIFDKINSYCPKEKEKKLFYLQWVRQLFSKEKYEKIE